MLQAYIHSSCIMNIQLVSYITMITFKFDGMGAD